VAADLDGPGAGATHDGRVRPRAERVPGDMRAGGRRAADREPGARGRVRAGVGQPTEPTRQKCRVDRLRGGGGERDAAAAAGSGASVLFYDFLIEEGVRDANPVGRGRYTPGRRFGG